MGTPYYPTNAELQAAQARGWEDVPVPELGEGWVIRLAVMSARARVAFERLVREAPPEDYPGITIACAAIDVATGRRRFTDADADWLNDQHAEPIKRLFMVGVRLNALEAGAVGADAKNF